MVSNLELSATVYYCLITIRFQLFNCDRVPIDDKLKGQSTLILRKSVKKNTHILNKIEKSIVDTSVVEQLDMRYSTRITCVCMCIIKFMMISACSIYYFLKRNKLKFQIQKATPSHQVTKSNKKV